MTVDKEFSSIADSSKPNPGRIYDYLLGGNHNFEVDRLASQRITAVMPLMPKAIRLVRWFLREAVVRLSAEGYTKFLDFASGLPTVDHIHLAAPKGSRVIYSDLDPVTVSYGREIVKDNPDTRYVLCDATQPETLLNDKIIREMFGEDRKLAIGFNGILWFLPDEKIARAMKVLYDWAGPGSKLFLTAEDTVDSVGMDDARIQQVAALYKSMGQPFYPHSRASLLELVKPWKPVDPGFRAVEDWIDMKKLVNDAVAKDWKGGGLFGAFFVK